MTLKKTVSRHLSNVLGWRTGRKIVVIESDDWGSTRFPNLERINIFKKAGYNVDKCGFSRYDCLESNSDMTELYNLLSGFRDVKGNHPIITTLNLVSNPDYTLILADNFQNYHSQDLQETARSYPDHDKIFDLYREGIDRKFVLPQFHGREHLNISRWMHDLQTGVSDTIFAAKHSVSGISPTYAKKIKKGYRTSFDLFLEGDVADHQKFVADGLIKFQTLFNYKARYFVPPNGLFSNQLLYTLKAGGVEYIGVSKIQNHPVGVDKYASQWHWVGQKNSLGQTYITRNAFFEPMAKKRDWVDECMQNIKIAFLWNKPAVISTHRANYTGTIDIKNRENGLSRLHELLSAMLKKWPEVEFMSSVDLGILLGGKK
jgi:hypothetical protein